MDIEMIFFKKFIIIYLKLQFFDCRNKEYLYNVASKLKIVAKV